MYVYILFMRNLMGIVNMVSVGSFFYLSGELVYLLFSVFFKQRKLSPLLSSLTVDSWLLI